MELTPIEIEQLNQLCQWIWQQPCHAAYSSSILQALPHLSRWMSSDRMHIFNFLSNFDCASFIKKV
jgi:hypothetical protein